MNLRAKLLIAPIFIFSILAIAMQFIWWPMQLDEEKEKVTAKQMDILHNIAPSLTNNLIKGDLSSVYAILNRLQEINFNEKLKIQVFNPQGKRLYPLVLPGVNTSPTVIDLEYPLEIDGDSLGTLHMQIDWAERQKRTENNLKITGWISLLLFGLTLVIIYITQEILIRRPLNILNNASLKLAEGDFKTNIPTNSNDEIGTLAKTFNYMRLNLKKTQEALKHEAIEASDNAARFQSVLSAVPGALFTTNKQGLIEDFNSTAEEIFGYEKSEIVGRSVARLYPDELNSNILGRFTCMDNKSLEAANKAKAEYCGKRKNGSHLPMRVQLNSMHLNQQSYTVAVAFDITKTKAAEQQLLFAKDEAERANEAKSEFLSRMSHELRTPLNAILGFGQMLELDAEELNETQLDNVSEILSAGDHLLNLINEVLDLSRIESGRLEVNIKEIHLAHEIQKCVAQLEPLAIQKRVTVEAAVKASCIALADEIRLKQVLINLLSNAIKYNREGGQVRIFCSAPTPQCMRVSVQDTGPGIPSESLPLLFKPFERLQSAIEGVEGTGIGLALAKRLVEAMNGEIGVKSTLGEGSTFWFELPT